MTLGLVQRAGRAYVDMAPGTGDGTLKPKSKLGQNDAYFGGRRAVLLCSQELRSLPSPDFGPNDTQADVPK